MPEDIDSINSNSSILISRNSPLAFVVGVGGFIGSHLVDGLLEKGIQIIGVDNFSTGLKENLVKAVKNRNFHLFNKSISEGFYTSESNNFLNLKLERLDYAFFVINSDQDNHNFQEGLKNFLSFIKLNRENIYKSDSYKEKNEFREKPKIVLISNIDLYERKIRDDLKPLKIGEINFAKFSEENHLNARVVRLASVFGPRMHFRQDEPVTRLIQAALLNELDKEQTSLEFSSRALYISDAVNLLLKTVLSGSTAKKIYDGVAPQPVKVSEIKQILLDPLWFESKGFIPTELPPWLTPNLERTVKELAWNPKVGIIEGLKNTVFYFKENQVKVPELKVKELDEGLKRWSFKSPLFEEDSKKEEKKKSKESSFFSKNKFLFLIGMAIISYGLIFPILSLGIGAFSIKAHLKESTQAIEAGDFNRAISQTKAAKDTTVQLIDLVNSVTVLKRLGLFNQQFVQMGSLLGTVNEAVDGINHATVGIQALFETTKVISGDTSEDPKPFYKTSQIELTVASQKLAYVQTKLNDVSFIDSLPKIFMDRVEDLRVKLGYYANLVDKGRAAAYLLPQITGVDGKRSYLVLLENNLELRPGGGFIGSYAKLDFENGRLAKLGVDDVYNLDGNLKGKITPPPEIASDLGQNNWYMRDANFEPDFPTSARQVEFFYNREAGEVVNGVFGLDLSASANLLKAVGGVDLSDYGEHIDNTNLFERSITHAEVNFFPGSQAKKNYLTALESQLFNKMFYLSKQNWPAIIQALSDSLDQKHLVLYMADNSLFSYALSQNWAGVLPRQTDDNAGISSDFLAAVDANMGANKSNYYLERGFNLDTTFSKEGVVNHTLRINYKNNSPSDVFPAGKYKNRLRVYLPLGTKLTKASWGESDITDKMSIFSDYNRTGFSTLLELLPKDQKTFSIEYSLSKPLNFSDGRTDYRLDVIKEAGTDKDRFDFSLSYPINYTILGSVSSNQQLAVSTDLNTDRSFEYTIKKK